MYNMYMAIEPMCIKFLAINPFDVAHTVRGALCVLTRPWFPNVYVGLYYVLYIQTRKYENCIEPKLCGLFTLRGRASRSKSVCRQRSGDYSECHPFSSAKSNNVFRHYLPLQVFF